MSDLKRPSIQDVSRLAGVSVGTVSNALNKPERVREATLAKVNAAIDRLGFIRNDAARQLKAGRSSTIGLVVIDPSNPFFGALARGAEDFAVSKGYSLVMGNSANDQDREDAYLRLFEEQRVAGVLVSPVGSNSDSVSKLINKGMKTILVDRSSEDQATCSVGVDDVAGGRIAAEHLIEVGRKKLAFVGGPLIIKQVSDRLLGAKQVVAANPGITIETFESSAMTVLAGREVGARIVALSPAVRPDAIFAANDLLAVGILQALVFQAQVKVPQEIAIIGYDDIDFAEAAIVPLSSIRQPAAALGSTAVELLVDEIERPDSHVHRQVSYQPKLVIRASTSEKSSD